MSKIRSRAWLALLLVGALLPAIGGIVLTRQEAVAEVEVGLTAWPWCAL